MIDEQIASARQAGYSDQEIVSFLQSNKPDLAPKISEALKAQYSPTDIINHLAPPKAGIVGNLVGGTLSTVADIAKTGEKLGLISKDTSKAADDIAANSYGGKSYGERWHSGEKGIGTGVGTALIENAPRLAMGLGAGAAGASLGAALGAPFAGVGAIPGAAIGGALGSALGFGGVDFLQNYGRRLQEREDKNEGAPATATDKAIAAGTSIPQAALGALQVSKFLPAVKMGERTLGQAAGRMAEATATGAATGFVGDTVEQIGRNVGTKTGSTDIGQSADAAILGAITGAGVRGAGETAGLARQGMNKMATRGYDHPDEVPNVAARLNEVAETNGLNLKKLNEGAQALKIVNDEIQVERTPRSIAYKEANKAIALAEQEGFDPKVITSARLALEQPKPSKDQISALQEVVKRGIELKGDWAEAQKAVDFARRSNTVQELMKRTNFSESGGEPTIKAGGLSGLADAGFKKLMSTILSPIGGAGALGGAAYAGYAGLPAATAMAATASKALPIAATLTGGYGALRGIDSALNTRSGVSRFVEGGYPAGGSTQPMGGEMQSMRARLAATKAMDEWMRGDGKRVKPEPAYPGQQYVAEGVPSQGDLMNQWMRGGGKEITAPDSQTMMGERIDRPNPAQEAKTALARQRAQEQINKIVSSKRSNIDENAIIQTMEANAEKSVIAEGRQNRSNEMAAAKTARALATAQSKLDKARGVKNPKEYYESITQLRDEPSTMNTMLERVKTELAVEEAAKRNAKTSGSSEEPTARKATGTPEETTTTNRKAKANSVPEGEGTGAKPVEAPAATGKQKGASAKEQAKGRNKGGKTGASAKEARGTSSTKKDTPFKYGKDAPKIKNLNDYVKSSDARSMTKVQTVKEFGQRSDLPKSLRTASRQFVAMRSRQSARRLLNDLAKQFPEHKQSIMDHFDLGGEKGQNSVVNRVFKYKKDSSADTARNRKVKD